MGGLRRGGGGEPAAAGGSLARRRNGSPEMPAGLQFMPMRMLIEEELHPKQQPVPGLIAKLMGLETLPSSQGRPGHSRSHSQTMLQDKYCFPEDSSRRRSTDDMPEFKDVYEVMETADFRAKPRGADKEFIRQKFIDAKRLSMQESLRSSQEYNEALEALVANKEILLECLEDGPAMSPRMSRITILKPSRRAVSVEKELEKHASCRKNAGREATPPRNAASNRSPHRDELADGSPTRIVVLKPSLDKAQNMEGALPLDEELFHFGCRRPRSSQLLDLHNEATDLCFKAKASREIAREVTAQLRKKVSRSADCAPSLNDPGPYRRRSSEPSDGWDAEFSSAAAYSAGSSFSREARRQLSNRWKMANRSRDLPSNAGVECTLEDMLAMSDREVSCSNLRSKGPVKMSSERNPGDARGWPIGISSSDGWKDGSFTSSARSRPQPSSSFGRGSPRSSSRKRSGRFCELHVLRDVLQEAAAQHSGDARFSRKGLPENRRPKHQYHEIYLPCAEQSGMLSEREIHVNSEQLKYAVSSRDDSEQLPDNGSSKDDSYYCDPRREAEFPAAIEDEQHEILEIDGYYKEGDILDDDRVPNAPMSVEAETSFGFKEDEQPSPVSVLDPSSETESCSGCFEKISADLQGLRKQLRLLKNADHDGGSDVTAFSDDEHCSRRSVSNSEAGEAPRPFKDEEERDFSYIVEMFDALGIDAEIQDDLVVACYLLDSPARTELYEQLEEKYGGLILWPRTERKLLFDLASKALADLTAYRVRNASYLPGLDQRSFVEELWRRVVVHRRASEFPAEEAWDVSWAGSEDAGGLLAREVADLLSNVVIDELVAELLLA